MSNSCPLCRGSLHSMDAAVKTTNARVLRAGTWECIGRTAFSGRPMSAGPLRNFMSGLFGQEGMRSLSFCDFQGLRFPVGGCQRGAVCPIGRPLLPHPGCVLRTECPSGQSRTVGAAAADHRLRSIAENHEHRDVV